MNKKKKIKINVEKNKNSKKNISIKNTLESTDEKFGRIAFTSVHKHHKCKISDWTGEELNKLIETFKKIESFTWKEILRDKGLNFERNSKIDIELPKDLPKDISFSSMRVNGKMRIYGYRAQEYFYIVWFDRKHLVCPFHKSKRETA